MHPADSGKLTAVYLPGFPRVQNWLSIFTNISLCLICKRIEYGLNKQKAYLIRYYCMTEVK